MNARLKIHLLLLKLLIFLSGNYLSYGQEKIAPLHYNPVIGSAAKQAATASTPKYKTTSLTLPFFEDFTGTSPYPDPDKWTGYQVYINNTMCDRPISHGVATFDALNQYGQPYDPLNPNTIRYADSLTSKSIDLSTFVAGDSIYMSFFYQAGGNGFFPDKPDSFMLYFKSKTTGSWIKVWSRSDSTSTPFRQVMVPITNSEFLYTDFQFRFVNKASIGVNDDTWNLDYIRINTGRTLWDTAVNDIAYVQTPSPLLGDYTSMPYRQYLANPAPERATLFNSVIRNNYETDQSISGYGFNATLLSSGVLIASDAASGLFLPGKNRTDISFGTYSSTPGAGTYDKVVFRNEFYCATGDANKTNDTIIAHQVFDNYLAYDDGTAEMSYFLNLFPTLPGKLAIEHHLNQPDTLRGVAIYFGRQVPLAGYKYFSIEVYSRIAYGGHTTDDMLYRIENQRPSYIDTINHFFIYKFDRPIPLTAGTFFIGTTQPALSGSDSLYFGLDRNRTSGNHAYYNVLNYWVPSTISGAIMIRPLLGQAISGSSINETPTGKQNKSSIWPNPATEHLQVRLSPPHNKSTFRVINTLGQIVLEGTINKEQELKLEVSGWTPGTYAIQLFTENQQSETHQFQKL